MKLLIVDDEKITRNGLMNAIDWNSLQITELYEAENGKEGVRLAFLHHPEIILTDVRMPQIDGIQMAKEIRHAFPDTIVIFMSGYSDKEYLKAAIRLNAVNYVEKPLNLEEVKEAVLDATKRVAHMDLFQKSTNFQTLEHESQLALLLTHAPSSKEEIQTFLKNFPLQEFSLQKSTFTSIILQFQNTVFEFSEPEFIPIQEKIGRMLEPYHLREIHVPKHNQHLCYFLYGPRPSNAVLYAIAQKIQSAFSPLWQSVIAVGDSQSDIYHAYNSYLSAVILLQRGFFCDTNVMFQNDICDSKNSALITDFSADFTDSLSTRKQDAAFTILSKLLAQFRQSSTLLPSQVKDVYYKLFLLLQNAAQHMQLTSFLLEEEVSIWDMISTAPTLTELHRTLVEKTEEYFSLLSQRGPSNQMIFNIKNFIHQNYQNDSLSVKSVSDYVMRSSPYVCTFFKAETGQTLNQYITDYRIKKALLLLEDSRYKIAEVAAKVGYSDVNYFGKIFKKAVGLSPSEYRGQSPK